MTKKLPEPITKKTFEKITSQWLKVINYGENAMVMFFPFSLGPEWRLRQLLKKNFRIQIVVASHRPEIGHLWQSVFLYVQINDPISIRARLKMSHSSFGTSISTIFDS